MLKLGVLEIACSIVLLDITLSFILSVEASARVLHGDNWRLWVAIANLDRSFWVCFLLLLIPSCIPAFFFRMFKLNSKWLVAGTLTICCLFVITFFHDVFPIILRDVTSSQ